MYVEHRDIMDTHMFTWVSSWISTSLIIGEMSWELRNH